MSNETGFAAWIDSRLPTLKREWNRHMAQYYAPKNFNFWYLFGIFSLVVLVIQLVTGIWLLMSYQGSAEKAILAAWYSKSERLNLSLGSSWSRGLQHFNQVAVTAA